jgi:hypothetical protein
MPRFAASLALYALVCCGDTLAAARIAFERTIAPPQNLGGAEDLAIIYAIGDNEQLSTFLEVFIRETNQGGTLRVHDATAIGSTLAASDIARRRFRRRYGTELFIRINTFTCATHKRSGEGSAHDHDGKRVRRKQQWFDAACRAHLDMVDAETMDAHSSFGARGEGTSPRVTTAGEEEREIALEQAARYTAVVAAEQITPRRVRETIDLIEKAPSFDAGMAMIDADRLEDARRIWENAAAREKTSAALQFNLGAVCEAGGDVEAARKYYEAAQRLAPGESRYRWELEMFRRRNFGVR